MVSWKSNKQGTLSRSSAEAEYRSMRMTGSKTLWLRGFDMRLAATLRCDNIVAIQIDFNLTFHEHLEIDCHFDREKLLE